MYENVVCVSIEASCWGVHEGEKAEQTDELMNYWIQ